MFFKSHLQIHWEFVFLNLLGLGKNLTCTLWEGLRTTVSHRQLGQDRADALPQCMDVPSLASAVALGKQPGDPCIAAACIVSLLIETSYPCSLQFFLWGNISKWDYRSTGTCFTLLPLKSLNLLPLGSLGGELGPYWPLLKTPLFNEEKN